jgi:IclR family transcriptional regulator, acetate operon repressor
VQVRRVSRAAHDDRSRRGLSTARAALQVAWMLARRPEGTRADEVAETLGKSVSTAYNVLASLCEEGVAVRHPGGLYRLAPGFRETVAAGPVADPRPPDFSGLADDLLARTHKRAYVGVVDHGRLRVVAERGQRGMPKLPGLDPDAHDSAHALAMGKVVLALGRPEAVERYVGAGLPAFTPKTITDPAALREELAAVRRSGIATDCEEFDLDFCCMAAPILDLRGHVVAVAGISMSRRAFDDERPALEETLRDVVSFAGRDDPPAEPFQASADRRAVLDPAFGPGVGSGIGSTVR